MKQPPCIIPVAAADAIAWANGNLNDSDLLLNAPLTPEAIFIVNLPDLRAYRPLLVTAAALWAKGCRCLITRTGNVIVGRHLLAAGCTVTAEEGDNIRNQKFRYLAGPEALERWIFKFSAGRFSPMSEPQPPS